MSTSRTLKTAKTAKTTRGRSALLAILGLAASAMLFTSDRARAKPANLFQILTGFSSKEACSCAFVVDQTDEYCQAFGQSDGYEVTVAIDRTAKTVTSTFAGTVRTSRYTDGAGCVVDALP